MKKLNEEVLMQINKAVLKCKNNFKVNENYIMDYLHDAFITVVEKYETSYKEEGKLDAWVKTVTTNHIITKLKREQKYKLTNFSEIERKDLNIYKPGNKDVKRKILTEYAISASQNLPPIDREIISRKVQNMPDTKIAKEMNLNIKTVRKHIAKSYNAIRKDICEKYHNDYHEPLNYNEL